MTPPLTLANLKGPLATLTGKPAVRTIAQFHDQFNALAQIGDGMSLDTLLTGIDESHQIVVAAKDATIVDLKAQLAAAGGGLSGVVDINLNDAAGDVLFEPALPSGYALAIMDGSGAATSLPATLTATGNKITRGAGKLVQDRLSVVRYKGTKRGVADTATGSVTFRETGTTPAPRAFDRGRLPRIITGDVWQVAGSGKVKAPVALVHVDDGTPYFMSKTLAVRGVNAQSGGVYWTGPNVALKDLSLHPYHNSRRMYEFNLPDQTATGTFTIEFRGEFTDLSGTYLTVVNITVHIVANAAQIPSTYSPTVYTDDPTKGVPVWSQPASNPTFMRDYTTTFDLQVVPALTAPTGGKLGVENYRLNKGDFVFWTQGLKTNSGREIAQTEVAPVVTYNSKQWRAFKWVDCRNDKVAYVEDGTSRNLNWVSMAVRDVFLPMYGYVKRHLVTPIQPNSNPPRPLDGNDYSDWRYLPGGREHDWNESIRGEMTLNHHDQGGGNTFSFTAPDASLFVGEHVRYYHFTATSCRMWVGAPDAVPAFVYEGPQFYPGLAWPFVNTVNEGPSEASDVGDSLTTDYSQFQTLLGPLQVWDTDGSEADPKAA